VRQTSSRCCVFLFIALPGITSLPGRASFRPPTVARIPFSSQVMLNGLRTPGL